MPDIIKKIRIKDVTKTNTFHPETEAAIVLRGNSNVDADLTALETAVENVAVYSIVKDQTAEAGYAATYHLTKDGVAEGASINIPKDFFVRSAEVKVCEVADQPIEGLVVGDKYIDFTININDGTAQDAQHIYIAVKDLFVPYTAGDGIAIEGTTIAAKVDGTSVYVNNDGALSATGKEYVAGDNITITEESGESGEMVNVIAAPDAWTKTNLVAGADISITEVQKPVIDGNTVALWHLDGNTEESVGLYASTFDFASPTFSNAYTPFENTKMLQVTSSIEVGTLMATVTNTGIGEGDFTIDFWGCVPAYYTSSSSPCAFYTDSRYANGWTLIFGFNSNGYIRGTAGGMADLGVTYKLGVPTHFAMERIGTKRNYYIDGKLITTTTFSTLYNLDTFQWNMWGRGFTFYMSELRLSNIARYQGQDFTPFDQPYAPAGGPAQYKIDCALDISGKLDKTEAASTYATQSAVTTGLAAKQDTLTAGQGIKIENNVISMDLSYTVLEESGESSES